MMHLPVSSCRVYKLELILQWCIQEFISDGGIILDVKRKASGQPQVNYFYIQDFFQRMEVDLFL